MELLWREASSIDIFLAFWENTDDLCEMGLPWTMLNGTIHSHPGSLARVDLHLGSAGLRDGLLPGFGWEIL